MPRTMLTMLMMKMSRTTVSQKLLDSHCMKSIDVPSQIAKKFLPGDYLPSLHVLRASGGKVAFFLLGIWLLHTFDIDVAHTLQDAFLGEATLQPLEAIEGGIQHSQHSIDC